MNKIKPKKIVHPFQRKVNEREVRRIINNC
jgi:hypothetical protein